MALPIHIAKDVEEDVYALKRQSREQGLVRTCLNSSAEWTSELLGKTHSVE
jgi:hypothetical protein